VTLTSVGLAETQGEALDDLRVAAHFGIETMVGLKNQEDSKELLLKQEEVMGRIAQEETSSDLDNARN
jgi:hypothetical protein